MVVKVSSTRICDRTLPAMMTLHYPSVDTNDDCCFCVHPDYGDHEQQTQVHDVKTISSHFYFYTEGG